MTLRRPITLLATAAAFASLSLVALAWQQPGDKPKVGFQDTPMLPGGKWHVHDGDRPRPPIVTPGANPGDPPSDAVVLFDGKDLSKWQVNGKEPGWKVEDGAMVVPPGGTPNGGTIASKDEFGDCQIHVEWSAPNPPKGRDQGRGNSGVLIMGRYEIQVLDSFDNVTYADGQASAVYGQHPPMANASRKPGEWQTYDITFTAPRFKADGTVETPAYVTALHNGVLVQDHVELLGPMTYRAVARYTPHGPRGPLAFQDHGNPVRYRNIWVREIKPVADAVAAVAKQDPAPAVPKGEVTRYPFADGKVFPGTTRDYWVYVPRQYDPSKPACVHVNQDGIQNNAPAVFDELIAKKEIPVLIGVFVQPGRVKAIREGALDRANRSYEYDSLGGDYARFILDELLPDVEKKTTADGRAIKLSKDGNDRSIGGSSSGAAAAFTAAWERPDAFRRVFSTIGTYVGLRGANVYPTLIRKVEPKPLRVFLQDGSADLNSAGGDWWMANQEMERALKFAGYEVDHAWGEGGHDGRQAGQVFPDAMRWLWKDHPAPIKAGAGSPQFRELTLPGEEFQLVGEGYKFTEGPIANAKGEVFFTDIPESKAYKISLGGEVSPFLTGTKKANGLAFGPDGRLFAIATETRQIMVYDADGTNPKVIADDIAGNDLVVGHDGRIFATNPNAPGTDRSRVWSLTKDGGEKKVVDIGLGFANGVTLSPDQSLAYVTDMRSHWVYSYQVQPDGSFAHKQKFYHLHVPDTADDSGADGMKVDGKGLLYVATRMGVQVCDQAGKVNLILPTPNGRASNLCFGGPDLDTLFVTAGDKVYKRKMKAKGINSFDAPVKPPAPRL